MTSICQEKYILRLVHLTSSGTPAFNKVANIELGQFYDTNSHALTGSHRVDCGHHAINLVFILAISVRRTDFYEELCKDLNTNILWYLLCTRFAHCGTVVWHGRCRRRVIFRRG